MALVVVLWRLALSATSSLASVTALRVSAPIFSYQMLSGTKKSAPKINMDDAKIDDDTAEKNEQQTIKSQNYTKK